jgi:hypothetical protein
VRPPIATVPTINTASEAPVAWSPKQTDSGRPYPHTRDPVIARRSITPVARSPQKTRRGAGGLDIDRERRRSNPNRNKDLRVGCLGRETHKANYQC